MDYRPTHSMILAGWVLLIVLVVAASFVHSRALALAAITLLGVLGVARHFVRRRR